MIDKFSFYSSLTSDEKVRYDKVVVEKKYNKGELISNCFEGCMGALVVISGKIRVYLLSDEGKEITLFNICEGENCVMSASCVVTQLSFQTSFVAAEDLTIFVLSSKYYQELTENNLKVKCETYEMLLKRFSQTVWVLEQVMFKKVDQRVAYFLLDYINTNKTNIVNLTHEEIAVEINSAREVVSRMLRRFSEENIIEITRGEIVIKDKEKLNIICSET